jgi:succinyl-CoA synthetase beta subunit
MAVQINELTFLKQFADRFGIPVPRHIAGESKRRTDIKKALDEWGGEALVKPDILAGKRGKAGAVVSVSDPQTASRELKRIANTEFNGKTPRGAYMVEKIPAEFEIFTAITYNSSYLQPSFTLSLEGGMDIEDVPEDKKATVPVDIFTGFDAYQASELLAKLGCKQKYISALSRMMVGFWDLFHSTGMQSAEINPWRITPKGKPYACDFKATIDENNYKAVKIIPEIPDYPENVSAFEEEMAAWSASSHQGQAHVSELDGDIILPILFGGGASTIITETLEIFGGSPIFLSDFGGNPPYERMLGTAKICFEHKLKQAKLLLILGGRANNTFIDVTFQALGDALVNYVQEKGPINIPVVVGRGGPRLVKGLLALKQSLEYLKLPYVIFGPDTPVTLVAEYASRLVNASSARKERVK